MTLRIILNNKTELSDFVESVTWSGHSEKFNRQLDVNFLATQDGRKPAFTVREGDAILFSWNKVRLFIGIVFALDTDISGKMSLTCYDANVYLTKSHDIRKFTNKKASDIIRTIAKDFGIPVGDIADTGYVIPKLIFRDKSLYEMILMALTLTRRQTGKRFFVGNNAGKLTLTSPATPVNRFVLKAGANILGANYSRSIEETKTQVKVTGGPKKKPITAVAKNDALRQRLGVLQHVEEMDEKASASQVKQRAANLLSELAVINDQANVDAFGIPEVITGTAIYVVEPMTGLVGGYYVSNDSHKFENGLHTMSLELSRTYDLPPIEIDKEVLGIEPVKKQSAGGKRSVKTTKSNETKRK